MRGAAAFVWHVSNLIEHKVQIRDVIAVRSGPACGQHTRHPVEGFNGQTGVIGEGRKSGLVNYRPGLDERAFSAKVAPVSGTSVTSTSTSLSPIS